MSLNDISYDVVIIGGGPAGFAAAIASKNAGAKTLIIEKRKYNDLYTKDKNFWASRNRNVAIDKTAIKIITELTGDSSIFKDIENYVFVRESDNITIDRSEVSNIISNIILDRQFEGIIPINVIERALFKKAKELGVDYLFDTIVTEIDDNRVVISGKTITTKYIICAEGEKSKLLSDLGFRRSRLDNKRFWYVENFRSDTEQECQYIIDTAITDITDNYHSLVMTYKNLTTIYLTSFDGGPIKDKIEIIMSKRISKLGIKGICENDITSFVSFPNRIRQFSDSDLGLLIIGDAARNVGPLTGFGVTLSIHDSDYIYDFISKALGEKDSDWDKFDSKMEDSVNVAIRQIKSFTIVKDILKSGSGLVDFGLVGTNFLTSLLNNNNK